MTVITKFNKQAGLPMCSQIFFSLLQTSPTYFKFEKMNSSLSVWNVTKITHVDTLTKMTCCARKSLKYQSVENSVKNTSLTKATGSWSLEIKEYRWRPILPAIHNKLTLTTCKNRFNQHSPCKHSLLRWKCYKNQRDRWKKKKTVGEPTSLFLKSYNFYLHSSCGVWLPETNHKITMPVTTCTKACHSFPSDN